MPSFDPSTDDQVDDDSLLMIIINVRYSCPFRTTNRHGQQNWRKLRTLAISNSNTRTFCEAYNQFYSDFLANRGRGGAGGGRGTGNEIV